MPNQKNLPPGYEQKAYSEVEKRGTLRLIASQDGREGSVTVHQDLNLYATVLAPGESVSLPESDRHFWVQVARGSVLLNSKLLHQGDGAAVEGEALEFVGEENAEVLVFDLT
uniref:pirin family protein n=1 Tax=Oculatella sp. LEGE 06141 TaxID=1828648 RepID=UPI0030DC82E5